MGLRILYDKTYLGTALDNCGVFNGENEGYGWSTHFKQNNSFMGSSGKLKSNLEGKGLYNYINDNDLIDAWINDQDRGFGILRNED